MEYRFTITVSGVREFSDADAERLYECGCDDGSPASRDGTAFVMFDRESHSLEKAISSAIANITKAGFEVERIEVAPEQFVTA